MKFLGMLMAAAAVCCAQPIEVDWENRAGPSGCPLEVSSRLGTKVIVRNINNVLHSYNLTVLAVPRAIDDVGKLGSLLSFTTSGSTEAKAKDCGAKLEAAGSAYAAIKKFIEAPARKSFLIATADADGKYPSVKLSDTLAAWTLVTAMPEWTTLRDGMTGIAAAGCTFTGDMLTAYKGLQAGYAQLEKIDKAVNSAHTKEFPITMYEETDYTFTVIEFGGPKADQPTPNGKFVFDCKPESHVLTLSGGVLASTIADRSYSIVDVPKNDPNNRSITLNETYRALKVDNSSNLRPALVALLNYRLYSYKDKFGLALSSGPAYKAGSNNQASNLGYFAGVSIHIPRYRFFITPGVHLGEYADFPPGYSQGSFVPASVTQITPQKRWTLRFGISLSYRTNAFTAGSGAKPAGGSSTPANPGSKDPPAPKLPAATDNPGTGTPPATPPTGTPPATPPTGTPGVPNPGH